jgi:hypothetical protein
MPDFKDVGLYRYRLTDTKGGSDRYGRCEKCGEPADRTFQQYEEKSYIRASDGALSWTSHLCGVLPRFHRRF